VDENGKRKPVKIVLEVGQKPMVCIPWRLRGAFQIKQALQSPYIVEEPAVDSLGEIIKALDSSQQSFFPLAI
jgi:hypothetical protein